MSCESTDNQILLLIQKLTYLEKDGCLMRNCNFDGLSTHQTLHTYPRSKKNHGYTFDRGRRMRQCLRDFVGKKHIPGSQITVDMGVGGADSPGSRKVRAEYEIMNNVDVQNLILEIIHCK